jgi:RHS repeat-associated protein
MTDYASGLSNNGYFSFFCKVKYHFNARWYDADTARFISEDPARDGVSWFAYVGNNPLRYVDPTGLRILDLYDWIIQHQIKDETKMLE